MYVYIFFFIQANVLARVHELCRSYCCFCF